MFQTMMIKKRLWFTFLFCFSLYTLSTVAAAQNQADIPLLDKISYQLSAKKWIDTEKVLLSVRVDATLQQSDVSAIRADIMKNLSQLAAGSWHITAFNRSQDNSGLEKLEVLAQLRAAPQDVNDIYQKTKKISKPGMNFLVHQIDFTPSLKEIEAGKTALRAELYTQVKQEIQALNQSFNPQHYQLHQLTFTSEDVLSKPLQNDTSLPVTALAVKRQVANVPLVVSNELIMTAFVELATSRNNEHDLQTT